MIPVTVLKARPAERAGEIDQLATAPPVLVGTFGVMAPAVVYVTGVV